MARVSDPVALHLAGAAGSRISLPVRSSDQKEWTMTDEQLLSDAQDELLWEPRLDSGAIAVSAHDGVVTLRGTVGSFRERREATNAVKRVYGATSVDNQLQVRLLDADKRDDADLRGAVLQALMLDALVPDTIDATVSDAVVTLTGRADFQFERDEAEFVAGNVIGVLWVEDEIELVAPTPSPTDVKHDIKKAMERDAKLDADDIDVVSADGTVTLTGTVSSWAEHDAAVGAAWAAPGVSDVDDRILVEY
jgi:osmotically-inducible protein OsmY